jgi:hypothetical protein
MATQNNTRAKRVSSKIARDTQEAEDLLKHLFRIFNKLSKIFGEQYFRDPPRWAQASYHVRAALQEVQYFAALSPVELSGILHHSPRARGKR